VALSFRCYLFEDGDAIKRIPRRVVEGLVHGQDAMPEYANSVQRIATAIVDNEDGKPIQIVEAQGEYWTFDEEGKINKGLTESVGRLMSMFPDAGGNSGKVVSLSRAWKRREFQQNDRWKPSKEHLDWITTDIWPNENDRSAPKVTLATGKAPNKPPLTYEAKEALREIDVRLSLVLTQLDRLSEPALKGLEFEARSRSHLEGDLFRDIERIRLQEREIRASRDFSDAYSDWLKAKGGIEDPGVPEEEQAERYRAESAAERRLFTTPAAWPDQVWQKLMAFEILLGEELLNGERRDSIILLSLASIKQDIHNLGLCNGGAS
jgi:hypothetical protein